METIGLPTVLLPRRSLPLYRPSYLLQGRSLQVRRHQVEWGAQRAADSVLQWLTQHQEHAQPQSSHQRALALFSSVPRFQQKSPRSGHRHRPLLRLKLIHRPSRTH